MGTAKNVGRSSMFGRSSFIKQETTFSSDNECEDSQNVDVVTGPNRISDAVSNRLSSGYFTPKLEPDSPEHKDEEQVQIETMDEIEGKMNMLTVGDGNIHLGHSLDLLTDSDKELEPNQNQPPSTVDAVTERPPMNRKLPSYLDL